MVVLYNKSCYLVRGPTVGIGAGHPGSNGCTEAESPTSNPNSKTIFQKPKGESKLETANPKLNGEYKFKNDESKSLISIRRFHFGFAVWLLDSSFLI